MSRAATALGNRVSTAILVAAALVAFRAIWPDADRRGAAEYVFVLTLGYGHLIGAAAGARGSIRPAGASLPLWRIFCALTIATLFCGYFALLDSFPPSSFLIVASPLLAVSLWHMVENDFALADAYEERMALGRVRAEAQVGAGGVTVVLLAGVVLLRRIDVPFADIFAATTLYHLFQWLVFLRDRIAAADASRSAALLRAIFWSHAPVALLCAILVMFRSDPPATAYELVFSPALYLFWSSLHVLHTALCRQRRAARRTVGAAA